MTETDDRRPGGPVRVEASTGDPARPAGALDRWSDRASAWLHLLLIDHGIFRLVYLNSHRVGDRVWRAAQPAPHDLGRFARKGVRTVMCIRAGVDLPGLELEREACERLGLDLIEVKLRGRAAPSREAIEELIALFRRIEYPVLIHCKSGADRTGLVAAIYKLVIEQRPLAEAMGELSPWYGHLRGSRAGILDAFFDAYAAEGASIGLSFETWLLEVYDADRLSTTFRDRPWITWFTDTILRREY